MNIISQREAMAILTHSLFNPINGRSLTHSKFDNEKNVWVGKAKAYEGREVRDVEGVHAVYVERRTDTNGPYAQLMCIS